MGTRRESADLADVLFGKIRGKILGWLFGHPDEKFFFQQIRRQIASAGVGAVQRELRTLVGVGIVVRERIGHQVFFRVNREHYLYPELQRLISKTVGAVDVIRKALVPFRARISVAFVYGSVAKGAETAASDIDLMLVGKARLEEVLDALSEAERSVGRSINPTTYSIAEFRSKLAKRNHFLTSVMEGTKLFLMGSESELRRLTQG